MDTFQIRIEELYRLVFCLNDMVEKRGISLDDFFDGYLIFSNSLDGSFEVHVHGVSFEKS